MAGWGCQLGRQGRWAVLSPEAGEGPGQHQCMALMHAAFLLQQTPCTDSGAHHHTLPALPPGLQMNSWRCIADMADSRAYGSCASLGDAVFAVGGLQSDMQASRTIKRGGAGWGPGAAEGEHEWRVLARACGVTGATALC